MNLLGIKYLVIGAGGHSRVVLSILQETVYHGEIGIIDFDEAPSINTTILNSPIIGSIGDLSLMNNAFTPPAYIAIGDCSIRRNIYMKLKNWGYETPNLVSKSASIHSSIQLGEANIICPDVFIGPEVILGNNNLLNTRSIVEHQSYVGNHSHLAPACVILGSAKIADSVFIGSSSVILQNIHIESNVTIGANSTVVRDIKEVGSTLVGSPAKPKLI
jgi:UDP-perosamine 4-acetyltransferase